MTQWEYLYLYFQTDDDKDDVGYMPLSVNGQKVQGNQGKTLHDYSNWLGQQ